MSSAASSIPPGIVLPVRAFRKQDGRPADGAGHGLGVVSAVERIPVLAKAVRAETENPAMVVSGPGRRGGRGRWYIAGRSLCSS